MPAPSPDPDLDAVRALQAGDHRALDVLMGKYREPLFRFIHRYVLDEETARDLLQETFVHVYFGIGRFKPKAKFTSWLYRIALNLCRNHFRSAQCHKAQVTRSFDEMAEDHRDLADAGAARNPAEIAVSDETLDMLENAIAELPHDLKTALLLFSFEGHSQQECAEALGISPKAVETRVYRARKILAKKLAEFV